MPEREKLIETIAADLVMVDIDDLPALSNIHEQFLTLKKTLGDDVSLVACAAQACADLVEKIVLNDVPDKQEALTALNESITALQGLVVDDRQPEEVSFPKILNLTGPASSPTRSEASPDDRSAAVGEDGEAADDERYVMSFEDADNTLLADFINEAREHLASAEQMLMDLETGEDYDNSINAIFRSFHTIKGAAGFLDLNPILVVAHESETLLDLGRKGTIKIESRIADICFDAIDVLRQLMDSAEEGLSSRSTYDGTELIASILTTLRYLVSHPDESPPEVSSDRVGDRLIDMGAVTQEKIDQALKKKASPDERLGETLVKQKLVPAKQVARVLRDQQRSRKDTGGSAVKEKVKIDTDRLDRLVDTIGELVIAESMVGQDEEILAKASHKVTRNIGHLNKITRELQEMGMAMRLVPVKATFQKLARAVRDLTRKSGKKINLEIFGEDTEVDRSIVELIGDPLIHMIRNACDHGIGDPEERSRAGKPETGTVTLRAYHKGGNIYFDIEDDGRGLNKDKLYAKALERGLIDPGREMTEKEIFNLVFLPGFSTAKKITNVSGRGVGMDVVRKNVEALRGSLDIDSTLGAGTRFSMKLPLTLAIIDGMLVEIAGERYIIPTLSVVESLLLTGDMISTVNERGEIINLRGELLPLIRINRLFGLKHDGNEDTDTTVVVVEEGNRKVGLVIKRLLGQRQTVIKSLGPTFAGQKWISGGAILSNGQIGLIIDIGGVIALSEDLRDEIYRRQVVSPAVAGVSDSENKDEDDTVHTVEEEVEIEGRQIRATEAKV